MAARLCSVSRPSDIAATLAVAAPPRSMAGRRADATTRWMASAARPYKPGSGGRRRLWRSEPELRVLNHPRASPQAQQYWTRLLRTFRRPAVVDLLHMVDVTHPMGLQSTIVLPRGNIITTTRTPCLDWFMKIKSTHPTAVGLVRIGDFYEGIGYDALVLMEKAGLNPMARDSGVPRAGLPKANIHKVTRTLTLEHGFTVVIVEELPEYKYGRKSAGKMREVAAVLTPAQPYYTGGRVDTDIDHDMPQPRPYMGVAAASDGSFMHMRLDSDGRTIHVSPKLSEDAVWAHIRSTGFSPPLLLHSASLRRGELLKDSAREKLWQQRAKRMAHNGALRPTEAFSSVDPVAGFEQAVRRMLGWGPQETVTVKAGQSYALDSPRPLPHSTVQQLGLDPNPRQAQQADSPSILRALVRPRAPLTARLWLRKLLLLPPPAGVAAHVREALTQLTGPLRELPMPAFDTPPSLNKVTHLLLQRQANDGDYRDLQGLLTNVATLLEDASLAPLASCLLPLVQYETRWEGDAAQLAAACRNAISAIAAVVPSAQELREAGLPVPSRRRVAATEWEDPAVELLPDGSEKSGAGEGAAAAAGGPDASPATAIPWVAPGFAATAMGTFAPPPLPGRRSAKGVKVTGTAGTKARRTRPRKGSAGAGPSGPQDALERLVCQQERFRTRVHRHIMGHHPQLVEQLRGEVLRCLQADYGALWSLSCDKGDTPSRQPSIVMRELDEALWFFMPNASRVTLADAETLGLLHPNDRNGAIVERTARGTLWVSRSLAIAGDEYRLAAYQARTYARLQLQQLAVSLRPLEGALRAAVAVATITCALTEHVRHAWSKQRWTVPEVGDPPLSLAAGRVLQAARRRGNTFVIKGMWPYWMHALDTRPGGGTVCNDLTIDHMALLTGPNMAGKSTVLRALCAVALLANVGLLVPAEAARVPFLDAFYLRNFSGDAPVEGRSSFAVEMGDMAVVLREATHHSLVLVDELGKGTEVRAGTALAGAMLERLAALGCRGIFATHLHLLHALPLKAPHLQRWRMEVAPIGQQPESLAGRPELRPTWRVMPGVCTESMALDVARKWVPAPILHRAAAVLQALPDYASLALNPPPAPPARKRGRPRKRAAVVDAAGKGDMGGKAGWLEQVEEATPKQGPATSTVRQGSDDAGAAAHPPLAVLDAVVRPPVEQQRFTIHDARGVLARLLAGYTHQERSVPLPPSSPHGKPASAPPLPAAPQTILVLSALQPPPAHEGAACVYVVRWEDGHVYAGETAHIHQRQQQHRRRRGLALDMDMAYAVVRDPGVARRVEALLIRSLAEAGMSVLSTHDAGISA